MSVKSVFPQKLEKEEMGVSVSFCSFLMMFFWAQLCCFDVFLVNGKCLPDQKTLLIQVKDELAYDSSVSTKLVEWNLGSPEDDCCFWAGIDCDSSGNVVQLDLSEESISGGINETSSLFSLRFLQKLSLAGNHIGSGQLPSSFQKLNSLVYLNLSDSGFAGQIPGSFSEMTSLVSLDLSLNSLQLENPNLEFLVQNLSRLRELCLDGVNLSAQGHSWCQVLSSSVPDLQVLSLSSCYLSGPIDSFLSKLKSLTFLRLDFNMFWGPIPEFFGSYLPHLTFLSLRSCGFSGVTPQNIFHKPTLQTLDLSGNVDLEGSLPEFPANLSIQILLLNSTQFSGTLPDSIGNLKMLSHLDLSECKFVGAIPSSIESLTRLVIVSLYSNNFNGTIPSFSQSRDTLSMIILGNNNFSGNVSSFQGVTLDNLVSLELHNNSLEGKIPETLFFLPSLVSLDLSQNKFSGQISSEVSEELPSSNLKYVHLYDNQLEGPVPQFLFHLQNLQALTLSWNKFNGTLELNDFGKLPQLVTLELSYNMLVVDTNSTYSEPSYLLSQFKVLTLASCGIRKFPFLRNLSQVMILDLSNNQIAGEIPSWLWEVGDFPFISLNLSHNQLTHFQEPYSLRNLNLLDLHSNFLTGNLPTPPITISFLDLSSNNFVSSIPTDIGNYLSDVFFFFSIANNGILGSIPESLCQASNLEVLDLSNNTLANNVPPCLFQSIQNLAVLNLGQNNLSGYIPEISFSSCSLETFDLSGNLFEGKVPASLSKCSNLKVLNLGNNTVDDGFPCWINNLTNLRVLSLRNNHFHGTIECPGAGNINNYSWPINLQIVDLAVNNFSGNLPKVFFSSLKAMTIEEDDSVTQLDQIRYNTNLGITAEVYYQDSVSLILKGREILLQKVLTIFTSIDISSNHFQGNLPETVGELRRIHLLNLSHNDLNGRIPPSIGNLKQLESLDLSFNHLSGEIPMQVSGLTYLSFLNLSYNMLVGMIPSGRQMHTFTESSFLGNSGLCGFAVNRSCNSSSPPEFRFLFPFPSRVSKSDFCISAAIGFVASLVVMYLSLLFNKKWKTRYNYHLDRFVMKILGQRGRRRRLAGEMSISNSCL